MSATENVQSTDIKNLSGFTVMLEDALILKFQIKHTSTKDSEIFMLLFFSKSFFMYLCKVLNA